MTVEESIAVMVDRLVSRFSPEKIILFGSRALGDAQADSDVNLLVVMPACEDRKAATVSMMKSVADLSVGQDIVVTTVQELETRGKLKSTILYHALREGKALYAR